MTTTIPLLSSKGYQELWVLSNDDPRAFFENPCSNILKELLEQTCVTKGVEPDELWDGELIPQIDLQALNDADSQSNTTDASNARLVREAFPDITPATSADHRIWASVNCFALLRYTTMRWNQSTSAKAPCRTDEEQKLREWVQEHYLGHGADMKQDNAAARLWWLTEIAERVSAHSKHSADRLLSAMANDVEMYHQLLFRPYLVSNPRVVGKIYDLALTSGNDYMLSRPYPNRMLQNLNLKAAAVSLGSLSDATLSAVVEEAKPPKGPKDTA